MINKPKTVLELFEKHPERWIKGAYGRLPDGDALDTIHRIDECECFCLSGAITFVYGQLDTNFVEASAARLKVRKVIGEENSVFDTEIVKFNDAKDTTFEKVLEVVRKAGI